MQIEEQIFSNLLANNDISKKITHETQYISYKVYPQILANLSLSKEHIYEVRLIDVSLSHMFIHT